MDSVSLKKRTKEFSLRVIRLVESLPGTPTGKVIGNQLLRCATSAGANYRSALRAKSKKDFLSKLNNAIEEADESIYWMELLVESEIVPQDRLSDLMSEANQLVAIFVTTAKTTRLNMEKA